MCGASGETGRGLRTALETCHPEEYAAFQAGFAAALADAGRTGDDATLRALLDRWRPIPAPSP